MAQESSELNTGPAPGGPTSGKDVHIPDCSFFFFCQ